MLPAWFCSRANHAGRCRDDVTRTRDSYVPNVVRYQLRYIPLLFAYPLLKRYAKVVISFDMTNNIVFFSSI